MKQAKHFTSTPCEGLGAIRLWGQVTPTSIPLPPQLLDEIHNPDLKGFL